MISAIAFRPIPHLSQADTAKQLKLAFEQLRRLLGARQSAATMRTSQHHKHETKSLHFCAR
eukprot:2220680-Amphidinium_carterae.1